MKKKICLNIDQMQKLKELVRMGLATKREFEIERQIVYYVSDYGKKYLGCLLGCVIKEVE